MFVLDGFVQYEDWQAVMKKADEESKALLRHYGDILKKREDVICYLLNKRSCFFIMKYYFVIPVSHTSLSLIEWCCWWFPFTGIVTTNK